MKKIIVSALALALCCSITATVYAAEINEGSETKTADTAVTLSVDPAYTVTIPATVELDKVEGTTVTYEKDMTVSAAAGARLLNGETISVSLSGDFTMESAEGAVLPYVVSTGSGKIASGDVVASFGTSKEAQSATLHLSAEDPEFAGSYSDTVTFTLSIVNQ